LEGRQLEIERAVGRRALPDENTGALSLHPPIGLHECCENDQKDPNASNEHRHTSELTQIPESWTMPDT
jgi:hypothetical protein